MEDISKQEQEKLLIKIMQEDEKDGLYEDNSKYPIGGFAPGNYYCNCVSCEKTFIGDKRAVQCEPCAIKANQPQTPPQK